MNARPEDGQRSSSGNDRSSDPVRQRRATIAQWTARANRSGYALYGLAIVLFLVAFPVGWSGAFAVAITVSLVIGSILLAPAIVLGYAIKAAEREDSDLERRRDSKRSESSPD